MNVGLRGYLTRHNLATVNQDLGLYAEAEVQSRAILAERPDYEAAFAGLGEVYLAQERWPELEEVAIQLEATPNGGLPTLLLRGRAKWPARNSARGRDWQAAEKALQEVLALDPGHQEARHNLEVLSTRSKRDKVA